MRRRSLVGSAVCATFGFAGVAGAGAQAQLRRPGSGAVARRDDADRPGHDARASDRQAAVQA